MVRWETGTLMYDAIFQSKWSRLRGGRGRGSSVYNYSGAVPCRIKTHKKQVFLSHLDGSVLCRCLLKLVGEKFHRWCRHDVCRKQQRGKSCEIDRPWDQSQLRYHVNGILVRGINHSSATKQGWWDDDAIEDHSCNKDNADTEEDRNTWQTVCEQLA